jgi:hypothetical protein
VSHTYEERTLSLSNNITTSLPHRAAVAQFVEEIRSILDKPFQSITITTPGKSGAYSALTATVTWSDGTETRWSWRVQDGT